MYVNVYGVLILGGFIIVPVSPWHRCVVFGMLLDRDGNK
jgi:hypothetical protein